MDRVFRMFELWVRRGGGLLVAPLCRRTVSTTPQLPSLHTKNTRTLFEENVYGVLPKDSVETKISVIEEGLFKDMRRTQLRLTLLRRSAEVTITVLVYQPAAIGRHPLMLSGNVYGNHALIADPAVVPSAVWSPHIYGRLWPFKEESRGAYVHRFPIQEIVARGYMAATFFYGDVDPDLDDGFKNGVHGLFPELLGREDSWGSIGAWAYGNSRVLDALIRHFSGAIDEKKVVLYGFSRLAKSVLWSAATDTRFSVVVAEASGRGGAALFRHKAGEPLSLLLYRFPYFFAKKLKKYAKREDILPVDQHQLLALIAPRPLLVMTGAYDWWSDPTGQRLAVEAAREAYRDNPKCLEFSLRKGAHDPTSEGWNKVHEFIRVAFQGAE